MRQMGYRVLGYIDDFLISPSPLGVVASRQDCTEATTSIDKLMRRLGLSRQATKGEWFGSQVVSHLGVVIDTRVVKFFVQPRKVEKVQRIAKRLLQEVRVGRRWVAERALRHFCGVCVSLILALPWARFYTRSLYWDLSKGKREARGRRRLIHQAIRDLCKWRKLTRNELSGRCMLPSTPDASMHTDAADLGYGGTLNLNNFNAGVDGHRKAQGVWSWRDRVSSISLRELKAIRKLLCGRLGTHLCSAEKRNLLLHIDNQAVVYIANSFFSSSRPMMRELRRLKLVLDKLGLQIRAEWIPSVANRFTDALSRRFPAGDLQIRRQLMRSVRDGMKAPVDTFPYRALGEHPVFRRRQAYQELDTPWHMTDEARLLCPPLDLIQATVVKLVHTKAPAVLLVPEWPRQPWYHHALRIANKVNRLPFNLSEVWEAQRKLNPSWRLMALEINF